MKAVRTTLLCLGITALCWLGMQAVHELGHVAGAVLTGGQVRRVVLHPLQISRTDVAVNPHPGTVVWMGPILGCALPLLAAAWIAGQRHSKSLRRLTPLAWYFSGFCLIANGAYLAFGAADGIGDSGEILRTGSPIWALYLFAAITVLAGLACWHCLGSFRAFFGSPQRTSGEFVAVWVSLVLIIMLELWLSG